MPQASLWGSLLGLGENAAVGRHREPTGHPGQRGAGLAAALRHAGEAPAGRTSGHGDRAARGGERPTEVGGGRAGSSARGQGRREPGRDRVARAPDGRQLDRDELGSRS